MIEHAVHVQPVRGRRDVERFLRVPYEIYRDDPAWVPPLLHYGRQLLSRRRNAFFDHGDAAFWIAYREGRPVGRISAQINRLHLDVYKDATGNFGFIEVIDDQTVFDSLLRTAEDWLRARGMSRILGPYNLSINDEIGVLVDGFDSPPMIGMNHAPRYYAERLERAGYRKAKDLFAFLLDSKTLRDDKLLSLRNILNQPQDGEPLSVRPFNTRRFAAEMRQGIDIYNDAWADNWGFVPVTPREVDVMVSRIRMLVRPEAALFGEVGGRRVAMLMALPDVNEAIRGFGGRLLPFGWLKLLYLRLIKRCSSVRVGLMGVRREYRDGRTGVVLLARMIGALADQAVKRNIQRAELSWVLEDNRASIGICKLVGAQRYKTYRIFQKAL